jgi:amidohydrolase
MNIKLNINRNDIAQLASSYRQYIVETRRNFDGNSNLNLQEIKTSKSVIEELGNMGIPYRICGNTGIIATIKGNATGKTIALRADMDASEINEKTFANYEFQYKGVNQGIGSDGHVAMLLGAAKILNEVKNEINGTVQLIFQPAEELAEGASKMIEEGAIEGVDGVFGVYLWPYLESGKISVEAGPRMASVDIFKVIVSGKRGHAALPHQGVDATLAAASIVMDLQSIVSREMSPFEPVVVTVGKLNSGEKYNSLATKAILEGTTRCFNHEIRNSFHQIIERIVKNTANTYRAQAELEYRFATPPLINDIKCSQIAEGTVERLWGRDALVKMDKLTLGDDFAMYMEKVPGTVAFIGTETEDVKESHSIDEQNLIMGTLLYAQYAIDFLKE